MPSGSTKVTLKTKPNTRPMVAQDDVSRKRHLDHGGEMTKAQHNLNNGKHDRKGKQDRRKQIRNQHKGNHTLPQPEAKASEGPQDEPLTLPQLEVKASEDSCPRHALRRSTRNFIEDFEEKLRNIAPTVSGTILSDERLKENGDQLIQMSTDASEHVTLMLQNLRRLVTAVQSTKDSANSSLWEKLSSMTLRVAGRKKEENLGTMLEFMQTHVSEAAEKAERNLEKFLGHHGAFRSPLGVGTVGGVGWMDGEQATRARD